MVRYKGRIVAYFFSLKNRLKLQTVDIKETKENKQGLLGFHVFMLATETMVSKVIPYLTDRLRNRSF